MKTKTPRIATIGAAVQDVVLMGSALKAKRDVRTHDFVEQFALGSKIELDRVIFGTGGGATNAAATFAKNGFETVFMGKIGDDPAGEHIIKELNSLNIDTSMVKCDIGGISGYSTLLLAPRGERTVLVYRGVSQELQASDFDGFAKLRADWIYVSSLSGNLALLEDVIDYAKAHDIKLAINPGSRELKQAERLKKLLSNFDIISLNKEEAAQLTSKKKASDMAAELAESVDVAVVTDGPKGSYASDGEAVYKAGMYEDVAVIDRTGAGDAFTSGFVSRIVQGDDIPEALTFGSANSTSVVQQIGAKNGLLDGDTKLKPMKITKTKINKKEATHA